MLSIAAGREVVEDEHLVAALEQRLGQVRADEPRPAGDQNAHLGLFIRLRCPRVSETQCACVPPRAAMRSCCSPGAMTRIPGRPPSSRSRSGSRSTAPGSTAGSPIRAAPCWSWSLAPPRARCASSARTETSRRSTSRSPRRPGDAGSRSRRCGRPPSAPGSYGVGRVRARVKSGNDASLRAFDAAGFERVGEAEGVIELARPAGSAG